LPPFNLADWLPPFNRLIATFQFGWLPPFNLADCHTLFNSAWVPHNLGLGASLFIRPECRCI
jgi:hypothetical protein